MAQIRGTTMSVERFSANIESDISVIIDGGKQASTFTFKKDRVLKIPDYQREIRWEEETIEQLINDIKRNEKYLGNVIVTPLPGEIYEIIDGQQRIAAILMIFSYIKHRFGNEIPDIKERVRLELNCFSEFRLLEQSNFDINCMTEKDREKISQSDKYRQLDHIIKLYNKIKNNSAFKTIKDTRDFLQNLYNSQINVIISEDFNASNGTQYYIDVNLKGMRLDREDIFKGYVFAQDNRKEVLDLWVELKTNWFIFNDSTSGLTENSKSVYPFMAIIEDFIYCYILSKDDYDKIEINDNLCLTKETLVNDDRYSKGTHVVEAINNSGLIYECLKKTNEFIKLICEIVGTYGLGPQTQNLYKNASSDTRKIANNLFKKMLMDSQLIVPKALLVKFYLKVLLNNPSSDEIKQFYSCYFYWVLFFMFANKEKKKSSQY